MTERLDRMRQFFQEYGSGKRQPAPQPVAIPPLVNPLPYINPIYTQQQPMDAFAPMKAYQDYLTTGQTPGAPAPFQTWNPPAMPGIPTASPSPKGNK